jgi:hypothetical protein
VSPLGERKVRKESSGIPSYSAFEGMVKNSLYIAETAVSQQPAKPDADTAFLAAIDSSAKAPPMNFQTNIRRTV